MQFEVRLFVQAHHHGHYSVTVLGESGLRLYTADLDQAREDLTLVLGDRFERMHPRLLGQYAAIDAPEHRLVEVPEVLVVDSTDGPEPRAVEVSALVSTDKRWLRLFLPRWQLRGWIPRRDDPEEAVRALLADHAGKLPEALRLERRVEQKEWLETLVIDAEPPAPVQFTGPNADKTLLPEPRPEKKKEEDDPDAEDEDDLDAEVAKATRKKRRRPPTPTLNRIGVALHRQARDNDLERAFGRTREVDELFGLVCDPGACVVLVGERGVGKTTVLNELVYRIVDKGNAPRDRRPVYFVDASRLIAGEGFFGEWQRQCLDVVQEAVDAEIVWCIGSLHALLDAGKSAHSEQNVAQLLRPYLAGRRLRVVAEATTAEWARVELRDAGFARVFTPYRLEEPPRARSRAILDAVADMLTDETGIVVRPDGRQAIEDLTTRFRGDGSRLGQALHTLRRLIDDAVMRYEQAIDAQTEGPPPDPKPLDRHAVVDRFCAETGLPPFLVRDDLPLDPAAIRRHFEARIIGQAEAVDRMTDLVALMKAGLSDLDRPMGSFLFVGPTGVGKTEMSKALAEFVFGRRDRIVRFDMSEFVTPDSVHRFIGSAGEEGQLISYVRRQPFSVLLFDEIEKAHPAVFDVLLQVLGEARLSDQAGRTADFRNTVVLLTSNLGVDTFKRSAGFGTPGARDFRAHFIAEAERFFRPEFFNRIDHIVPFMPLEADAIDAITGREIAKWLEREGIRQRDLHVELADGVPRWLSQRGVEPRYGARPLKRLIEKALTAPLARHLAGKEIGKGLAVNVEPAGEALQCTTAPHPGARGRAAARSQVRTFLTEVADLRWQVQRWMRAAPYREMVHAVRLLDRLSRDRNFWADRQRAERRMRHSQRDRDLIETFTDVEAQIAGVEDLAYEAFRARSIQSLVLLQGERDDAALALDEAELALMGRTYEGPELATLYLQGGSDSGRWLRMLLEIYVQLAEENGWSMIGCVARETKEARRAQKNEEKEGKRRGREVRRTDPAFWYWGQQQNWKPLDPSRLPEPDNPRAVDKARRKARTAFIEQLLGGRPDHPRRLGFTGPHAAITLAHEDGIHQLREPGGGGAPDIKVLASPGRVDAINPGVVMNRFAERRLRVLDENRRTLTDQRLELTLALEPRLHRLYRRCMRASMYDGVFGKGAWRHFERG